MNYVLKCFALFLRHPV